MKISIQPFGVLNILKGLYTMDEGENFSAMGQNIILLTSQDFKFVEWQTTALYQILI